MFKKFSIKFFADRRALESAEYAALGAAIIVIAYAAYQLLGGSIASTVTWLAGAV